MHGVGHEQDPAWEVAYAFGRVESNILLTTALQAGYIVAALDSVAHIIPRADGKTKWNEEETACNPDIENVNWLIRHFKAPDAMGLLDADAPVFAYGVSNGGSMVSRTAQQLPFSAVVVYITNAKQFHDAGATIPPAFIVAGEADSTVGITGPCQMYESAMEQGIDVEFRLNVVEPVTPGLFTRINGFTCEQSLEVVSDLTAGGVLDDEGLVQIDPANFDSWLPHIPAWAGEHQVSIRDLLDERVAEHALTTDFRQETIGFLKQHESPLSMPEAPVCP